LSRLTTLKLPHRPFITGLKNTIFLSLEEREEGSLIQVCGDQNPQLRKKLTGVKENCKKEQNKKERILEEDEKKCKCKGHIKLCKA
jgi:hypothetical protein